MALSLLLPLAGCVTSPSFDYKGRWKGQMKIDVAPGTPDDVKMSMSQVLLTFDGMGRFTIFEHGLPKSGNFQPTSYGAALDIDQLMGKPIGMQPEEVQKGLPNYEVRPQADGTLKLSDARKPEESITLVRTSKP